MNRFWASIFVLSLFGCASSGERFPGEEVSEKIRTAALENEGAWKKMEELCDGIGARLSGSEALEKAIQWALETMKREGHENVRAEKVMVPCWVRGKESAFLLAPRKSPMEILGLGGSIATPPGGIVAEVEVVRNEEELEELGKGAKGKIVLFNNPMPPYDPKKGSGYGRTVRFRVNGARLASAHGAVAVLVRSVTAHSLRTPHTGGMNYGDAKKKIPAAAITTEDADIIARLRARGVSVKVRLEMEAKDRGLVPSANVVGELRGREIPEEVVVIGGHLDSWDVGEGAHDDATGCVMAMEALTILRKLNLTPRRTIRVVLYTNEENGLAGARQYVKDHAGEIENHVAAIESDSGGFRPLGFSVEMKDPEREARAAEQLKQILERLSPIGATEVRRGFSGADVGRLKSGGVACLGLRVEGSKYFDYHHTPADTLDKVDPKELNLCVTAMATLAYALAEMPGRLGDK